MLALDKIRKRKIPEGYVSKWIDVDFFVIDPRPMTLCNMSINS